MRGLENNTRDRDKTTIKVNPIIRTIITAYYRSLLVKLCGRLTRFSLEVCDYVGQTWDNVGQWCDWMLILICTQDCNYDSMFNVSTSAIDGNTNTSSLHTQRLVKL